MGKQYVGFLLMAIILFLGLSPRRGYSTTQAFEMPSSTVAATSASDSVGTLAIITSDPTNGSRELATVKTDGSNYTPLGQIDIELFETVAWSPNGKRLATWGPGGIYAGRGDADTSKPGAYKVTFAHPVAVTWSSDSQEMTVANDDFTISNFDLDTGEIQPVFQLSHSVTGISYLRWSPNGRRLAYVRKATNSEAEIHVIDVADKRDQMILSTGLIENEKVIVMWSPDSAQIAYSGSNKGSSSGIYIVDLASKVRTPVVQTNGLIAGSDWSPDGKQFVYSELAMSNSTVANGTLYIFDVDKGSLRQVKLPDNYNEPVVSISWQPHNNGQIH